LDQNGDMLFGHGGADYLRNTPETVAQAVKTRLKLWRGEWFLDQEEGTPYNPAILGMHTRESRDLAIRERILDTPGVRGIDEYESETDPDSRALSVYARLDTVYGQAVLQEIM
jgi:hypothetical protein